MSNTFGNRIRLTIFGQSHSPAIGAVIDGLPAGMGIDWEKVKSFMARRRGGGELATPRAEADEFKILSGLNERGLTCGAPLCAVIENTDARPADYDALRDAPRPGHSDYAAHIKFSGHNDIRGGGQFSGRLTAPLCLAGAICIQLLSGRGILVAARISSIGEIDDIPVDTRNLRGAMDSLASRGFPTLSDAAGGRMKGEIASAREAGDSIGGIVEAYADGVPPGLGEPMFDGVENRVASALFAIPGVKGVEFGAGFGAARMRGSACNDPFIMEDGRVSTEGNNHGGALGGITSGQPIIVRAAFKPTPSISAPQRTISLSERRERGISVGGRHDPCIVPRALPCVEAALALALMDMMVD